MSATIFDWYLFGAVERKAAWMFRTVQLSFMLGRPSAELPSHSGPAVRMRPCKSFCPNMDEEKAKGTRIVALQTVFPLQQYEVSGAGVSRFEHPPLLEDVLTDLDLIHDIGR